MTTNFPLPLPHFTNGFIDATALDALVTVPINDLAATTADSGWTNLTLLSGFTSYSQAATVPGWRRVGDVVYFRGSIQRTAGAWAATLETVANIPAGNVPQNTIRTYGGGVLNATTANGLIIVVAGASTALQVGAMGTAVANSVVYLDSLSYMAA